MNEVRAMDTGTVLSQGLDTFVVTIQHKQIAIRVHTFIALSLCYIAVT